MENTMLIGEVCRQAQCSPRTVRHYEDEKLIKYTARTQGGHKLYDNETVSVIRTAQLLKRLGYSIKDVRQIISLTNIQDTKNQHITKSLRHFLSDTISRIDSELALLSRSREKISAVFEETKKCGGCESSDCGNCGKLNKLRTLGLLAKK